MEYCTTVKKKKQNKGILTFCDIMHGLADYHDKQNKPVGKDKYHMISCICTI